MTMLPRLILVPYDDTEAAQRALAFAATLARVCTAKVQVLYVFRPQAPQEGDPTAEADRAQAAAEAVMADASSLVQAEGVELELLYGSGEPGTVICEQAAASGAGLIVMGTRGLSNFEGLLMGSVSSAVLEHAPCPVTLVR